jgi:hypothetical protein
MGGGQRDPSEIARLTDHALSLGTVHMADAFDDMQFYCKTVALGSFVKIARNAGAATRV